GTYMTLSTLHQVFQQEDNGFNVQCIIVHPTFAEPDVSIIPITVYFSPVQKQVHTFYQIPLNRDYDVIFRFSANPRPTALKWSFGRNFQEMINVIEIPFHSAKFSTSLIIHANGNYTAILTLAEITNEDIETKYKLHVANEIGKADYSIILSEDKNPI
ncbi:unnamed protein product, partial [Meganyctiphanes norvegica]